MNKSCITRPARYHQTLPWPLRCATWLVIVTQVVSPFSNQLFAADEVPVQKEGESNGEQSTRPKPVTTPQVVAVNRTVPKTEPPSPTATFSENPSDEEIFRARVFAEPLVPFGLSSVAENQALAKALKRFLARKSNDDVNAITEFLELFPNSVWRASLLTDLGIVYRKTGHFSKALAAWEEAWQLGKTAVEPNPRAIVDRAVGELAELNARVGRYERLEPLFRELEGRELHGPATEKLRGAKQGLWLMQNSPGLAFRCGPMALDRIRASQNPADAFNSKIQDSRSTSNGMSLVQVVDLAGALGMKFQMAKRSPGAKIILPAVVHWNVGHYAALVRGEDGRYLVQDPTFTDDIWVSQATLEEETSGYFLIPNGSLPEGWRSVDENEGKLVWGKGNPGQTDPNRTKCKDSKVPECKCDGCKPMADYSFHTMLVSLHISDSPVGYSPPRGPAVSFKVSYNQKDANQASIFTYSNLGNKWTFDWLAYLVDDPINTTNDVLLYLSGGGAEVYTGYNSGTSSYATQPESHAVLKRTSSTSYERTSPDGSKQIYNVPDGASAYPRRVFLKQELDPAGNALTYTYDASLRITAVTDAIGQVTTVSYQLAADSLKITKVTDPFGRYATFDYTLSGGVWQLTKITDVIGITSEFTYNGDFITTLKTPYGQTAFTYGESSTSGTLSTDYTRWLEATDPLGQTEHLEYRDEAPGIAMTNAPASVPTGLNTFNNYLNYRNSFYWDKKAWHDYPGDYTKAHIYHFLHTSDPNVVSGLIESEKAPLESRVWRNYPGQTAGNPHFEGTNGSPSKIARVLDDGTTQLHQFAYNSYGKVTQYTDPSGRVSTNTYASNGIDLTELRQKVGTGTQLLAKFTYNSLHLPLTAVDAAGQTTSFGYNSSGQITAATNALDETLAVNYNTNSYPTNVIWGKLTPGNGHSFTWAALKTNSFTWDGYGRVRTATDEAGYTLTFDYDAADRPTKITYPDNTFEQVVYRFLDPVLNKDRRGHWTAMSYDQLRRVTDVQDSLNRFTHLDWCGCGGLASITDPLGRTTTWLRDVQGRVQTKIYPDSTQIAYDYETNSSRLKSVTDAKNQATLYNYFVDDDLKQVTYSNAVIATPSVSFTYDTNYNRLLTMVDGVGTNTYSYNAITTSPGLGAGRLASVDGPFANDTVTYFYDELGRVTNRAINSVAQTVAFDSLDRITVITNALGKFTNAYVGATWRVSTNFYPNGQKTVFSYYATTNDFRLQTIQNLSNGTNLSKFDYTYDADGQIATWTQQADAATSTVLVAEYDPVDQLLGATVRSNSVTGAILKQFIYAYDKGGNRTSEQIQSGAGAVPAVSAANYNNLNQLTNTGATSGPVRFKGSLSEQGTVTVAGDAATVNPANTNFVGYAQTSVGTNVVPVVATDYSGNVRSNRYQLVVTNNGAAKTLKYDLNGNLTNIVTATYTNSYEWDAADRLIAITAGTNRSEFTYDGYGRRVKTVEKHNGTAVSTNCFVWCGLALCEERNNTGATVTKRFFGGGEQISGTNYFFTRDHLGSVREMTDGGGNIKARYDYDPYGRRMKVSGTMESDFGFTGHYVHTVSGLHLAVFRAYDSETGRWLSRDPIQENSGLNLYAYVGNDPLNLYDPLGLADICKTLKFAEDTREKIQDPIDKVQDGYDLLNQWRNQGYYEGAIGINSGLDTSDPAALAARMPLFAAGAINAAQMGADVEGQIYSLAGPKFIKAPTSYYGKAKSWREMFGKAWDLTKTGCSTGYSTVKNFFFPPAVKTPYSHIGSNDLKAPFSPTDPGVYFGPNTKGNFMSTHPGVYFGPSR